MTPRTLNPLSRPPASTAKLAFPTLQGAGTAAEIGTFAQVLRDRAKAARSEHDRPTKPAHEVVRTQAAAGNDEHTAEPTNTTVEPADSTFPGDAPDAEAAAPEAGAGPKTDAAPKTDAGVDPAAIAPAPVSKPDPVLPAVATPDADAAPARAPAAEQPAQPDRAPFQATVPVDAAAPRAQPVPVTPTPVSLTVQVKTGPVSVAVASEATLVGIDVSRFSLVPLGQRTNWATITHPRTAPASVPDLEPGVASNSSTDRVQRPRPSSVPLDPAFTLPASWPGTADSAWATSTPASAAIASSNNVPQQVGTTPAPASNPAPGQTVSTAPPAALALAAGPHQYARQEATPAEPEEPTATRPITGGGGGAERIGTRIAAARQFVHAAESAGQGVHGAAASRNAEAGLEKAVAAQAARGVSAALNSTTGSVTIHLHPAALGQMRIQVSMDKAAVSARFEVSSPKAKALLERASEGLRDAVAEKGVALDRIKIDLAPRLPERDLGLPSIHAHDLPPAGLSAGFADPGNAGAGGQGQGGNAAGTHGVQIGPGLASLSEVGLGGAEDLLPIELRSLNYTIDASGRLRMDALA